MTDFHRLYCTHCQQTFHTSTGETRCDLCGKVGGLTDPDQVVAERIRQELERAPARTHATLDELIDDPSASPARKVLASLGILALLDGWLTYQFGFRSNGPPAWVVSSLVVVVNVIVLVIYVWRLRWAAHVDSITSIGVRFRDIRLEPLVPMKSALAELVMSTVGLGAMFAALVCAFATFATNDYRLILASGIGLSLAALACFAALIWMRHRSAAFYALVGVPPSLLALGELLWRAASMILQ
jgi:hypothetical protein